MYEYVLIWLMVCSSIGLGRCPFKAERRVRFSYALPLIKISVSSEAQYMRYVTMSINRKTAVKRVEA